MKKEDGANGLRIANPVVCSEPALYKVATKDELKKRIGLDLYESLRDVPDEIISSAIDVCNFVEAVPCEVHIRAIASIALNEQEKLAKLLKDPVAVRLNWLRGVIDASKIIEDDRATRKQDNK